MRDRRTGRYNGIVPVQTGHDNGIKFIPFFITKFVENVFSQINVHNSNCGSFHKGTYNQIRQQEHEKEGIWAPLYKFSRDKPCCYFFNHTSLCEYGRKCHTGNDGNNNKITHGTGVYICIIVFSVIHDTCHNKGNDGCQTDPVSTNCDPQIDDRNQNAEHVHSIGG